MSYVPVLKKFYTEQVAPELVKSRGYKNKHQVPKLLKINLNTGIDAEADKNQIADIARDMGLIAGQKPILNKTKRAIANFKLKPNQITGCHVTLRGESMWHFLMRLQYLEDAIAGAQAALEAGVGLVVGVSEFALATEADIVVKDLTGITFDGEVLFIPDKNRLR